MRAERGQVSVLVLGLALVVFAVAGLAVDGTRAFIFRRSLQNAADAAAIAAASELDRAAYYSSGGVRLELEAASARRVAEGWLNRRGIEARTSIGVSGGEVRILLADELRTSWLGLVGIEEIPVAVQAAARPVRPPLT